MKLRMFVWSMVVVFVVSMTLVGVGCKEAEEAAPVEEVEEAEEAAPVEEVEEAEEVTEEEEEIIADITVWIMPSGSSDEEAYYDGIIEQLQEKHPGINVKMETLTWDGYRDKINIAMASGTLPDVLFGGETEYAAKGLTAPVDDIINDMSDTTSASAIESAKFNGVPFMVPVFSTIYAWMINRSLAEELGVMDLIPDDYRSWSYDDFKKFLEATKEAGKEDGIYGAALYAGSQSSDSVTFGMLMSAGGELFNDAGTEIIINNPQSIKMLDYLKGLIDEELVPLGAATMKDGDSDTLWLSKKTVINITTSFGWIPYLLSLIEDGSVEAPFDAVLLEYPSFEGNPVRKVSLGVTGLTVFKNDNDEMKIEAAKEFLRILTSKENLPSFIEMWGGIPIDSSIILYKDNAYISEEAAKASSWLDDEVISFNKNKPYWEEIRAVFYPEIQAAYSGAKTSQQALDDFVENANIIINENE